MDNNVLFGLTLLHENDRRNRRRRFSVFLKSIRKRWNAKKVLHVYLKSIRKKTKSVWMKQRSAHWYEQIVMGKFTDQEWIKNFRMNRDTFLEICELVRNDLEPKPSSFQPRKPLSVEIKVCTAIYKLASCAEMRVIGNNMGVSQNIFSMHSY